MTSKDVGNSGMEILISINVAEFHILELTRQHRYLVWVTANLVKDGRKYHRHFPNTLRLTGVPRRLSGNVSRGNSCKRLPTYAHFMSQCVSQIW